MIKPLAKSVLIPLELTTAASAVDAGIHKNVLGSGRNNNNNNNNNSTATQIILNDEIEDIKIVKYPEDSGLLLKGVAETVQNEVKEQKGGFLSALLGTLRASLLGDLLIGKGIHRAGKGKGFLRAGYGNNSKMDF